MKKALFTLVVCLLGIQVQAQRAIYSTPVPCDQLGTATIIGKINTHVVAYRMNKSVHWIDLINDKSQVFANVELDVIPAKVSALQGGVTDSHIVVAFQPSKGSRLIDAVVLDAKGKSIGDFKNILGNYISSPSKLIYWKLMQHPTYNDRLVIYAVGRNRDVVEHYFAQLNTHSKLISVSRIDVTTQERAWLDDLKWAGDYVMALYRYAKTDISASNAVEAVVYDLHQNATYKSSLNSNVALQAPIKMTSTDNANELVLVGFVHNQKDNKEGIASVNFNLSNRQYSDVQRIPFPDDWFLNKQKMDMSLYNMFTLKSVHYTSDNQLVLVSEKEYVQSMNMSYAGSVGMTYMPYMNRRYKFSSDEMMTIAIKNQRLEWRRLLPKFQDSYDSRSAFMSFGLLPLERDLAYLYSYTNSNQGPLQMALINSEGEQRIVHLNKSNQDNGMWINKAVKQTDYNEFWIPVVYKSEVKYAAIKF